jgi:hypothetical protein
VPDTYGVVPADIAAELPGLFPTGFSTTTVPTAAQVVSFITAVDLAVTIAVQDASGAVPLVSDRVTPLAKRVIIERVKAMVIRVVYTGNAPAEVEQAARPYEDLAKLTLSTQAAGLGAPASRLITSSTAATRDLLVFDDELGRAPHGSGSLYADRGRY